MLKNLKKNQSGFTIIEVLIVLAIAGLIMVAVFTAVPALQRSSANTTRKNDAAKVLGAVAEFVSNNNGKVPKLAADVTTIQTAANLSTSATIVTTIPTTVADITAPTSAQIEIVTGVACNSAATMVTAAAPTAANYQGIVSAAAARSYVVLYAAEAGGGSYTTQCAGS